MNNILRVIAYLFFTLLALFLFFGLIIGSGIGVADMTAYGNKPNIVLYLIALFFCYMFFVSPAILYKKFFKESGSQEHRNKIKHSKIILKTVVLFIISYIICITLINFLGDLFGFKGILMIEGNIILKIIGYVGSFITSFLFARGFYQRKLNAS